MRKKCSKCGKRKYPIEFAWKNKAEDKRHSECKECHRELRKKYYKKNAKLEKQRIAERKKALRKQVEDYKVGRECVLCGEDHPACLQFHHRNRKTKEWDVSQMPSHGLSWERILGEIKKCDVLCFNCHMKLHWKWKWKRG
jgi:hypothetical protein